MSAKTLIHTVLGFLTHHVSDLNNLSDVLTEITTTLPIDSQDKDRINSAIGTVKSSADNIAAFLANNTVSGEVVVQESDLETAVANYLASDAGKAAIAAAVSAEGNANG